MLIGVRALPLFVGMWLRGLQLKVLTYTESSLLAVSRMAGRAFQFFEVVRLRGLQPDGITCTAAVGIA